MKTISLTDDDVIELKILLRRLELEALAERRDATKRQHQVSYYHGGIHITDAEREARKSMEVLNRILK